MKKSIITAAVVVAIALLLVLPKLSIWGNEKAGVVGPGNSRAPKLPVEAVVVKPTRLDHKVIVTGSIQANESLELKSETSGKITEIYFKEGKPVKKGDLLLQVNDDEIVAQIEKQKHNRTLNKGIEFRQRKLLAKDAISQEEYDNAFNRLKTTEADLELLQAQLDKTRIYAPFDGVIGLRFVSEGAFVTTSTVIATLYSMNPVKIDFAIPGRYSTQVRPGQKVEFTVEADTIVHEGEVYAIEPQIDPSTRTLKLRAIADNRDGTLLPGQFVRVELILETTSDAILVPTEAVIPELNGHKVYVVKNGKASEVDVETGIRSETNLEIVSGLSPSDTVITTGLLQLRPGLEVQITNLN